LGKRDRMLIKELNIPIAKMASVLGKSRQAVNRGIALDDNYFSEFDLTTVLESWRESNASFYQIAKKKVCEVYPNVAEAILEATELEHYSAFSIDVSGEYWLVTGDFGGFLSALPKCLKQLKSLCEKRIDLAQVKIFTNIDDKPTAEYFVEKTKNCGTEYILCKDVELRAAPTTLLRMSEEYGLDVFGVSDRGFVPLSCVEASRMRTFLKMKFLDTRESKTLDIDSVDSQRVIS